MSKAKKGLQRSAKALYRSVRVALRLAAFLLLLAVVLAVSAAVLVKAMFTSEHLRAIVVAEMQNALKRPVQVQDVDVLIWQGIRMRGLEVLESPEFPGKSFITSDTLLAKYKWTSLLRGRLEFSELRFISPRVRLVRRADGRWNIEDIFVARGARTARAPEGRFALPLSLAADVIAVDHGVLAVQDVPRERAHDFREVDLKVWKFDPVQPFALEAAFENVSQVAGRELRARASMKGSMSLAGFDWDEAYLFAERLRGDVEGKTVSAEGSLKGFRHPAVDLKFRLPPMETDYLSRFSAGVPAGIAVPATQWRARLFFPATGYWILDSLDGAAPPIAVRLRGSTRALPQSRARPLAERPVRRWRLEGSLQPSPLERVGALWEGWAAIQLSGMGAAGVTVSGQWGGGPPRLERFTASAVGLGGIFGKDRHRLLHTDLNAAGADNLDTLNFSVARGTAVVFAETLSDLNLAVAVRKGDLSVDRLDLTWDISRITLRAGVKNLAAPQEVWIQGSADKLPLDRTITAVARVLERRGPLDARPKDGPWSRRFKYSIPKAFPATSGCLRISEVLHPNFQSFNLEALWNVRGISTGLNRAEGDVRVGFGPGRVSNIPDVQSSHKILRVLLLPFEFMHKINNMSVISAATAYPKTLDFNRIYGEYGLNGGVVDTRLFHVDSAQLLAFADGKVDFPKEKVDMRVLTRLTESRGTLPEYLTDVKGRPSIGFFVAGDLNRPNLRLDLRKMEEDAIEEALRRASGRQTVFQSCEGGKP